MEGKTKLMKGGGEGTKMAYILFEHTNFICQVCKYLTGIKKNAPEGNKLHLHVMYLKDISEILPLDPFTHFFLSLLLGCHIIWKAVVLIFYSKCTQQMVLWK